MAIITPECSSGRVGPTQQTGGAGLTNAGRLLAPQPADDVIGHLRRARIMVVEDHPLVREGILAVIKQQPDLVCCAETDSIFGTITKASVEKPDLILLDIRLRDGVAFDLIATLKAQCPRTAVLVLSQGDENIFAEKAIRSGARGYLMKQDAPMELANAIRTVLGGKVYLSADLAARTRPSSET
jgi:DNA-binding NarL/FixJ family response regulator